MVLREDHRHSAAPLWGAGPLAQCQGATPLKTDLMRIDITSR